MSMTTQEIMEILPHRHPFLLIDTVEEVEPGVRAVAKKNVTFNEPFFAGHFPGNPVMPGVLIVEALAQTGAVAILSQPEWKGKTAYFAGINKAKFKQKVVPGDTLVLETEIPYTKKAMLLNCRMSPSVSIFIGQRTCTVVPWRCYQDCRTWREEAFYCT